MMELIFADVFFSYFGSQMDTAVAGGLTKYAHSQSLHRSYSVPVDSPIENDSKYCASCSIQYCFPHSDSSLYMFISQNKVVSVELFVL